MLHEPLDVSFRSGEMTSQKVRILSLTDHIDSSSPAEKLPAVWRDINTAPFSFGVYESDIQQIRKLANTYLQDSPVFRPLQEKLLSSEGTISEILALTAGIVDKWTGTHDDNAGTNWTPPLSHFLNQEKPLPIRCTIYQELFLTVFEELAKTYGNGEILDRYKLSIIPAVLTPEIQHKGMNFFHPDSIFIPHSYLSLLSYHADGTVHTSLLDPYWKRGEDFNPDTIAITLDFTHARTFDAILPFLTNSARKIRRLHVNDIATVIDPLLSILETPSSSIPQDLQLQYANFLATIINDLQNTGMAELEDWIDWSSEYTDRNNLYLQKYLKVEELRNLFIEKIEKHIFLAIDHIGQSDVLPANEIVDLITLVDYLAVHNISIELSLWEKIQKIFLHFAVQSFSSKLPSTFYTLEDRFFNDDIFIPLYTDDEQKTSYINTKLYYFLLCYSLFKKFPSTFKNSKTNIDEAISHLVDEPTIPALARRGTTLSENYKGFMRDLQSFFSSYTEE